MSTKSAVAEVTFTERTLRDRAFRVFSTIREREIFCDIVILVEDQAFPVHKLVLAGCSEFFRELFTSDEENAKKMKTWHSEELEATAVETLLNFFYSSTLKLTASNVSSVLSAAAELKVVDVVEQCTLFALKTLTSSNCLAFLILSEKYNLEELKSRISRFIEWNFKYIIKEKEFLRISPAHLKEIVSNNNLRTRKEEMVYDAIWKWFAYDKDKRRSCLEELMNCVRFCQISGRYISKKVMPDLVEGEGLCKGVIEEAQNIVSSGGRGNPRKPQDVIYTFSCRTNQVDRLDAVTNTCQPAYHMMPVSDDNSQEYHCTLVTDHLLYMVSKSRVEKYDPIELCWDTLAEGSDVRDAGVCTHNQNIYVVGGRTNGSLVKCFNTVTATWSTLSSLNTPRRGPCAVVCSDKLYVIGGYSSDIPLDSVERYDFKTDKWKFVESLSEPRYYSGAVTVGNSIYVIGGRNNERSFDTMEIYSPKGKEWRVSKQKLREERNEFGICLRDSEIYCCGGRGVNSIEVFNLETSEWNEYGKTGAINHSMNCVLFPPL